MSRHHETDSFAARIALLIEGKSANSFALKCGISEGSIRQYLAGTIPRMDKVVTMAQVAGVRVEWLATGEGPMRVVADQPQGDGFSPVSETLLTHIIDKVISLHANGGVALSSREIGSITCDI